MTKIKCKYISVIADVVALKSVISSLVLDPFLIWYSSLERDCFFISCYIFRQIHSLHGDFIKLTDEEIDIPI